MVFELDDFMEEIKMEMVGYEELDEQLIKEWVAKVTEWIQKPDGNKSKFIVKNKNSIKIKLKDESDLFSIVDKFYAAVVHEEIEKYWNGFSL